MLKNISRLEHIIDGKQFHLLCDIDSPIGSVKEALCQFMKYVGNIEDNVKSHPVPQDSESEIPVPSEIQQHDGT